MKQNLNSSVEKKKKRKKNKYENGNIEIGAVNKWNKWGSFADKQVAGFGN